MDVHISLSSRGRLASDVYRQLRAAILDGRLRPGDQLPATRDLAARLSVSRNTVLDAFSRLVSEGFATGRVGAGTFVAEVGEPVRRRAPAGRALAVRDVWRDVRPEPAAVPARYDFRLGSPDPALFPWTAWRGAVAHQLRGRRPVAGYASPEGDPALRAAIARHLGVSRSVAATADDLIVTSGAQQALDLIARVLIAPGDCVAIEEPGYRAARRVFEAAGARVAAVPVDREGLDVARLPDDAKVVYVTPSHQFPLGMAMSLERRLALLAWAERRRAAIVEDDYDSEFRFDGRPLEPLQSLDRSGRILYVGSFSKVLLPSLRIGFVVAPPSVLPALHAAKQLADSHGCVEVQRALAELIDDGTFARHLRRLIRTYRERRDVLVEALERRLRDRVTVLPSQAGLHVAAELRAAVSALEDRALAEGVAVASLAPYYQRRPRPGFALGFGLIAAKDIDEGVRRLARVLSAR